MTDNRDLTVPDTSDAGAIVRRNEPSRIGGRHPPHPLERSARSDIDRRIAAITRLSHGTDAEKAEYESPALQAELRKLAAQGAGRSSSSIVESGRTLSIEDESWTPPTSDPGQLAIIPGPDATADQIETFRRQVGVPARPSGYVQTLPGTADPVNATLWKENLSEMHAIGITAEQAHGLADIVARAARRGEELRNAALEQNARHARAGAEQWMSQNYGQNWRADVERANQYLRRLLPDGTSRTLANTRLEDGSLLGSNVHFIRALVELAAQR